MRSESRGLQSGTRKLPVENDYCAGWECVSVTSSWPHVGLSASDGIAVVDFGSNVEINRDHRYSSSSSCRPHPHYVHGLAVPSDSGRLSGRSRSLFNTCRSVKLSCTLPPRDRRFPLPSTTVLVYGVCDVEVVKHALRLNACCRMIRMHRVHRKTVRLRSARVNSQR